MAVQFDPASLKSKAPARRSKQQVNTNFLYYALGLFVLSALLLGMNLFLAPEVEAPFVAPPQPKATPLPTPPKKVTGLVLPPAPGRDQLRKLGLKAFNLEYKAAEVEFLTAGDLKFQGHGSYYVLLKEDYDSGFINRLKDAGCLMGESFNSKCIEVTVPDAKAFEALNDFKVEGIYPMSAKLNESKPVQAAQ